MSKRLRCEKPFDNVLRRTKTMSTYYLYFFTILFSVTRTTRSENELLTRTHTSKSESLPYMLRVCHRSDPNLNDCVKESIEELRPYLAEGIPELFIPSCEPLFIPEVVMNQGNKGSVSVQSIYRNIRVYGPSQFVLKSVKVDLEKEKIRIKVWLPFLRMTADYSIEGRILMLPISGAGLSEGNYTNIEANVVVQANTIQLKGKKHFNVQDVAIDFQIGHASIYLSDLFDGDTELGDAMNTFLNDNWRHVAQEFKPILEETIGDLFKKFANKLYHKFPKDDILPVKPDEPMKLPYQFLHYYFFIINDFQSNIVMFLISAAVLCVAVIETTTANNFTYKSSQDSTPPLQTAPIWLKSCKTKDPNLDECIKLTFETMFPYLAKGIPEIETLPFEPLHIDKVALTKVQGAVMLYGAFTNLTVRGPSNTTALYTKMNLNKRRLDIGLFIPTIKVESKYDLKGNILLLPLVGVGDAKLFLKNVTTHVYINIDFIKNMNETVMLANSMKVDFSLTSLRINLDNLFNGNKVLGRTVNTFLNQNSLQVVEDLKENIGENLSVIFKKIMNDAFSHIPTKLWLLDD
ncbi:uncharacterized protein LOC126904935 [Daktulosphaira vitifoliae]|uniref:uncharacterized protein LOC126904935 n=1 Tax=Daktulosphaira vitifoliae TaxID=58002 RepID=UPI0021AA139C|nr:uncharacterized protein LOC126904935 [Daktulosphaira vitifoliae]